MLKVLILVGLVLAVANAYIVGQPDEAGEDPMAPDTQARYPRNPYYDPSVDVQDEWQALLQQQQQQQDQPSLRDFIPDQVALESEVAQPAYVALQPSLMDLADYAVQQEFQPSQRELPLETQDQVALDSEVVQPANVAMQPSLMDLADYYNVEQQEFRPNLRELSLETQATPEQTPVPVTTQTTKATQTTTAPLAARRPAYRFPQWFRDQLFATFNEWSEMIRTGNQRPTSSPSRRPSFRLRLWGDRTRRPEGNRFGLFRRRPRTTTPSLPTE